MSKSQDKEKEESEKKRRRKEEEKQVEKNVKPSPKKKPPRTDRQNRRMKVEDKDMDSKDKDLSMNFKDIGGSDVLSNLSRAVLSRALVAFDFEPIESSEKDEGEPPEETERDLEEDAAPEEGEAQEDSAEEEQPEEEPEEPEPEPEPTREVDVLYPRAIELYGEPVKDLVRMVREGPETGEAALALELMHAPVPPNWKMDEVFEEGYLTLKARRRLRRHAESWDERAFLRNLRFLSERKLNVSLTTASEKHEDYFQAMIDLLQSSYEDFKHADRRPLTDLASALEGFDNLDLEYSAEHHSDELEEAVRNWKSRIRRSSPEALVIISDQIADVKPSPGTRLSLWLEVLTDYIQGALEMSKYDLDSKMLLSSLKSGMAKAAQYRGESGYIPREDPGMPPAPKWRTPDPLELRGEDYSAILLDALIRYESDYLKFGLRDYSQDAACRAALDYAIYDYDGGKYQARIDAPTYSKLLTILKRSVTTEVE